MKDTLNTLEQLEQQIDLLVENGIYEIERDLLLERLRGIYASVVAAEVVTEEERVLDALMGIGAVGASEEQEPEMEVERIFVEEEPEVEEPEAESEDEIAAPVAEEPEEEICEFESEESVCEESVCEEPEVEVEIETPAEEEAEVPVESAEPAEEDVEVVVVEKMPEDIDIRAVLSLYDDEDDEEEERVEEPAEEIEAEENVAAEEPEEPMAEPEAEEEVMDVASEEELEEVGSEEEPQIVLEEAPATVVLGDVLTSEQVTLADNLAEQQVVDVAAAAGASLSLRESIGVNDRYILLRDLFAGDSSYYEEAIEKLDSFESLDEAMLYIYDNFHWNPNSEGARLLMELLARKLF